MAGALLVTLALANLVVAPFLWLYRQFLRKQRWAMKALLAGPQMPHALAELLRMERRELNRWLGDWLQEELIEPVHTSRGEMADLETTELGSKEFRRRIRRGRIIWRLRIPAFLMIIDAVICLLLASPAF